MKPATSFSESLQDRIRSAGIVATLTLDDPADAIPVALALQEGGVDCLELTLRTASALQSLRRIRAELPHLLVGAGTILSVDQAKECFDAGAAFGVAPGSNPRVIAAAQSLGLPFAPGVCTPTDIEHALECHCFLMKFFPSEPSGGLPYLRSIAAPFTHLGVQFIPLGGIDATNAGHYLCEPFIPAIGGSWLAPRGLIQKKDWPAITANARQAASIVALARKPRL